MPRSKDKIILTTDDLTDIAHARTLYEGPLLEKVQEWAKGELARRKAAGKACGRPKGAAKTPATENNYVDVDIA